jgi:hypothetical protein
VSITRTVFSASASPATLVKIVQTSSATTNSTTVTPTGGTSPYTYSWALTKPTGSSASLVSTTAANPSFKADVAGEYVATMTITDGSKNVATSSVTLTACNASNASSPFSGCTSIGDNTGGTYSTSDAALALRRLLNSVATVLAVVVVGM